MNCEHKSSLLLQLLLVHPPPLSIFPVFLATLTISSFEPYPRTLLPMAYNLLRFKAPFLGSSFFLLGYSFSHSNPSLAQPTAVRKLSFCDIRTAQIINYTTQYFGSSSAPYYLHIAAKQLLSELIACNLVWKTWCLLHPAEEFLPPEAFSEQGNLCSLAFLCGTFVPLPWGRLPASPVGRLGPAPAISLAPSPRGLLKADEAQEGGEGLAGATNAKPLFQTQSTLLPTQHLLVPPTQLYPLISLPHMAGVQHYVMLRCVAFHNSRKHYVPSGLGHHSLPTKLNLLCTS